MNLRIEGQQLRFRISQEELKKLCSGFPIKQSTHFPSSTHSPKPAHWPLMRVFSIDITPQDIEPDLQLTFESDCIKLAVQKQIAMNLYATLPRREGIRVKQKMDAVQTLELCLEVDIRTQNRERSNHV